MPNRSCAATWGWAFLWLIVVVSGLNTPGEESGGHLFDRIAIIGASLSRGYNAPPGWRTAVESSAQRSVTVVLDEAAPLFFTRPGRTGSGQIKKAIATAPSLVLAIDFLFWFGYGAFGFDGRELDSEAARLTMLERGLALLEPIRCPLVLGDFPDMSAAVGRMLAAEQQPRPETLDALNSRLRAWAAERTNTIVLPLADWVRRIQARESIRIGAREFGADVTSTWLQEDRLHPTIDGLMALAMLVNESLRRRGLLSDNDVIDDPARIQARMKQAQEALDEERARRLLEGSSPEADRGTR